MENEASMSKDVIEQSNRFHIDSDSIVVEGYSMEYSPVHNSNDDDKQSDMDIREHEEEGEEVELQHPAMPPPFMPPPPPQRNVRHIRFRE